VPPETQSPAFAFVVDEKAPRGNVLGPLAELLLQLAASPPPHPEPEPMVGSAKK
jgi:hypothetical protein